MVKKGSLPTYFSFPCATLRCFVYFQVNTVIWSFLELLKTFGWWSSSPSLKEQSNDTGGEGMDICCGVSNDGSHSLVSRRGRDVHCIVGVLGKSSHTL